MQIYVEGLYIKECNILLPGAICRIALIALELLLVELDLDLVPWQLAWCLVGSCKREFRMGYSKWFENSIMCFLKQVPDIQQYITFSAKMRILKYTVNLKSKKEDIFNVPRKWNLSKVLLHFGCF